MRVLPRRDACSNSWGSKVISETIVVTGASGGVGSAIAERLCASGISVIGIDLGERASSASYRHIAMDLAQLAHSPMARESLGSMIESARVSLGGGVISGLVNNAALQLLAPAASTPPEEFRRSMEVNVIAPFVLAQLLHAQLLESGGCIVNISSIHAEQTKAGFCAYSTSKAALSGLSRALAVEWGRRIRVSTIEPAAIATPMLEAGFAGRRSEREKLDAVHPSGSIGRATHVADWVLRLIQDRDPYSNGMTIRVDGGIRGRLFDPVDG